MRKLKAAPVVSFAVVALLATPAYPCGESMFRVGFGMEIPAGVVEQSASIVIFKASDARRDVFFDDAKVSAKLDKAGHRVSLLDESAVDQIPVSPDVNVVIARADEIERARALLGAQFANAVFLPVTEGFTKVASGSALSVSANATMREILGVLQRAVQGV